MIVQSATLDQVCGITSRPPVHEEAEFAFVGRSNVGKSSLINALLNRKALARTSSQPGKTQTINYYRINDAFYFVDLPGYGYAKVARTTREQWGEMIQRYLYRARSLQTIFQLIDIRHAPTANDCRTYQLLVGQGFRVAVIATKADKISRSQLSKQIRQVREGLGIGAETVLIPFSSVTKQGRDEIWAQIEELLGEAGQ